LKTLFVKKDQLDICLILLEKPRYVEFLKISEFSCWVRTLIRNYVQEEL